LEARETSLIFGPFFRSPPRRSTLRFAFAASANSGASSFSRFTKPARS